MALGQASEEIVLTLVSQNLFSEFEELDKSSAITVFKSYLKLQKTIKSSVIRSYIKQSFVE